MRSTITKIASDQQGETFFETVAVELKDAGPIGMLSDHQQATGIVFRWNSGDYNYDWHTAPRRQYVIILEGEVDFTVSSGETRRFGPGDTVLLDDVSGKGHRSKSVDGKPRRSIFVTLN